MNHGVMMLALLCTFSVSPWAYYKTTGRCPWCERKVEVAPALCWYLEPPARPFDEADPYEELGGEAG